MRRAVSVPISDEEEDERDKVLELDEAEWTSCEHRGMIGIPCPICDDAGFLPKSTGERQNRQGRSRRDAPTPRSWRRQVERGWRRLRQVGRAGNTLPNVGQVCLVIRGEETKYMGQEAIVTQQTAARVQITYLDKDGQQATRVKHPGSLMLLEEGLHVSQDAQGSVWVRRR